MRKANYLALWVALLLKANHKDNQMIWNNDVIVVKEGQFITGRKELSKETGISETTIEDILKYLETRQQIQQQKTNKYRIITIVNWKSHQHSDNTSDNKATTKRQLADTNKNDNNVKNEKNSETSSPEIPLLIKSFESLNPASKKFYGNKTQREACKSLIENYGLERVTAVIERTLPKTNSMQYFPSITTALQLFEKWATLESKIKQYQSEKLTNNKRQGIADINKQNDIQNYTR